MTKRVRPCSRLSDPWSASTAHSAVGAGAYLWLKNGGNDIGHIYSVHDISAYDENNHGNVTVTLEAYLKGETGYVKDVICLFPPGSTYYCESIQNKPDRSGESTR